VTPLASRLGALACSDPVDLLRAALVVAEIEYPALRYEPWIDTIDRLGRIARERVAAAGPDVAARLDALNRLLFDEEGFAGNRRHYGDYRNSLVNDVLARGLGIPITLALVYMEVARRAGVDVRGVAFPAHFLMAAASPGRADLILDPFDAGRRLDEEDCRDLLAGHLGGSVEFDPGLLRPCTPRQLLARLLNNLKRVYVEQRSFPQARQAADLILAVDPTMLSEWRDRGLLAYHLDDFPAALRDLEAYLQLASPAGEATQAEHDRIARHVTALRRRVAGLN
jgi:regulator of sirC expression with transglutaminase-like and TPR domain